MGRYFTAFALLALGFCLGWLSRGVGEQADGGLTDVVAEAFDKAEPQGASAGLPESEIGEVVNLDEVLFDDVAEQQLSPASKVGSEEQLPQHSDERAFKQLLSEREYYAAVSLYGDVDRDPRRNLSLLRQHLLSHMQGLIEGPRQDDFAELAGLFLSEYYDDVDVLLIFAQFNHRAGAFMEAASGYQLALSYAYSEAQLLAAGQAFEKFMTASDDYYRAKEAWFSLINLYSHVDSLGMLSPEHRLRQALAMVYSGDTISGRRELAELSEDRVVGARAREQLAVLNGDNGRGDLPVVTTDPWADASTIALQRAGNQYLVNLSVDRNESALLLIDTGASMTTLSRNAFEGLSARRDAVELGRRLFQTANGVTTGTVYAMPRLGLGPFAMENVQIAVLEFDMGDGVDGLLGMNVLGQFRFQIDQRKSQLILDPQ